MSRPQASAPILVVDDEEVIAIALGETLRLAGYEVVTLCDPADALGELRQREFSVVISDQKMPGYSGLELLAEAKRVRPYATRILITGLLNLDTVIDAINQGEIFRFIVKPWLREEFLATVNNALQRYELLCQNALLQAATRTANDQLTAANWALEEKVKTVATQNQQLAEMNRALEAGALESLELTIRALDAFCPALGAQARCVAKICRSAAEVLSLRGEERRVLEHAARLYDIGLVGLPRQVIRRWQEMPDTLSPEEKALIEQHPVLSQQLLSPTASFEQVGKVIRSHHERYDGKGFPDGLAEEQSPWLSRILAIAVSYAAMRLPPAQALQRVQAAAGSLFDPKAVRVLVQALPDAGLPAKEREVALKDLEPGMVLARGIYSQNGLLLIAEGQRLNPDYINQLLTHHRKHPLTPSLLVYC